MAHSVQLACFITLLAGLSAEKEQSRWSRQISSYTADISDWVPLPGPVREPPQLKRQAVAEPRILSEPFPGFARPTGFSQDFPSRMFLNAPANRQLYLQSVPSAPQNYLSDQGFGQSIRFGLAQPNFPLNQVFVAPQYNFDSIQQYKSKPTPIPTTQIKFDSVPSIPVQNQPLAPSIKPIIQAQKTKPELPKFVDGYRVENISRDSFAKSKPHSVPKVKFEAYDKPQPEALPLGKPKVEREEVQLLYVPLESLNRGQFNFRNPGSMSQLVNTELFSTNPRPHPLKQNLAAEFQNPPVPYKTTKQPFANYNSQINGFDQAQTFMTLPTTIVTIPTTTPSPKPKKLKPHQPPLAIFLTQEAKKNDQVKVGDVLYSLKNANTVAVLDSVNPINAPKVFIGPNSLTPPENYVKFELPYLSNIEHTDKKLRQLPFFVAPLSYNTPQGFAKIPFPSPHVGSVVINSQIRETHPTQPPPTVADVIPNSYTAPPQYRPKEITQKPRFSYYSTAAPKTSAPEKYEKNYYSFVPQTVSTLRPLKEPEVTVSTAPPKSGSYFLSNVNQYEPSQYVNFPQENVQRTPDYNAYKPSTTTTVTTPSTTTKPPSTYPSQLLETHNPYSINQAFHFSTPVDYQNFFDEYKETYATSGPIPQTQAPDQQQSSPQQPPEKPHEEPEKPSTQHQQTPIQHPPSPPTYEQSYTPEIHYESEISHSRYPTYETNEYTTKSESTPEFQPSNPAEPNTNISHDSQQPVDVNNRQQPEGNLHQPQEYNENSENQPAIYENLTEPPRNDPVTLLNEQSTKSPYEYNQYETANNDEAEPAPTSSTTSTTTRRPPLRSRGRPRYSTTKSDNEEYSTRSPVTRRPLRERRPLPPRPRYEPNKITTERATRKPVDSSESTTARTYRTRSRGKVHYKPSESDDTYDKRNRQNSKERDLAYQRDVLHQNYPVTLMERMSTVDIEAMTEPTLKVSSTNNLESTNPYDAENAYSNDQVSITQHTKVYTESSQETPGYSKGETESDDTYVPRVITRPEDNIYHTRSSAAPIDAFSSYDETKEEDSYTKLTTPIPKSEDFDEITATKISYSPSGHDNSGSADNDVPLTKPKDDAENSFKIENNKALSLEHGQESEEPEENIVQTTPSYNRVRVRPGVIRQYHQASSTESTRTKAEKRKSAQAITYRPAFDRRRTTMRIDEIQADLKTKQVLAHPETQDVHPVYKPEPTTEPSAISPTQDSASKRGQFRRRRPTYTQTTTSTEASSTKKIYEVKNRFRGRRPTTEKPTEKPDSQTDESTTTTTTRSNIYSRYSNRPRLSERFNKKTEAESEGTEDQESNYSLHRPKYAVPDADQWSSKFSSDSFKPYNPNDVSDNLKSAPVETKPNNDELDIITAKNEYDDILISVTPASNNKASKIPDIPPTLEALVEQSKVTKTDSGDAMSTFESMLEEVMKSLEEQDQDEYTTNVMKHKGGEIGEIPPERIISSGETYSLKATTPVHDDATTVQPTSNISPQTSEEDATRKNRRRGFWKKVKVRPVTESIEAAESQYYSNTVNRLGHDVVSKNIHGKTDKNDKPRVTTYKPSHEFLKNLFDNEDDEDAPLDILVSHLDIPKINSDSTYDSKTEEPKQIEEITTKKHTEKLTTVYETNPGDMDLGTGSPDPTLEDEMFYSEPTEATINESSVSVDRSDGFSLMDYLFGVTGNDESNSDKTNKTEEISKRELEKTTTMVDTETTTEQKPKIITTESTYIPEEITAELTAVKYETTEGSETKNVHSIEQEDIKTSKSPLVKVESTSVSSFMDPANVVSTSMSTEVSHETEICFRGKCIKTNKDVL